MTMKIVFNRGPFQLQANAVAMDRRRIHKRQWVSKGTENELSFQKDHVWLCRKLDTGCSPSKESRGVD
jgi:hypothetical protein